MSKEAMTLALEALEESLGYVEEEAENAQRLYGQYPTRQARIQGLKDDVRKHMKAITALREALAEHPAQQQEPVGTYQEIMRTMIALRTGTVVQQQAYELMKDKQLYTSPLAERTWNGLTHDEYDAICDKHSAMSDFDFLADIEAKLREKNT